MDRRKEQILFTIIKEHIKTGAPVGSGVLAEKYKLDLSSATIRNEMADLEDAGYIIQPYTSAGRIPTEKAYLRYTENLGEKKLGEHDVKAITAVLAGGEEADFRNTAKLLAQLSDSAVFWAFHRHNTYYTGITNLLKQPEFRGTEIIYDISAIIDRLDEILDDIFGQIDFGTHILIGSQNPISGYCSSVIAKYKQNGRVGLFGVIGPMRMDYGKNLALVKYVYSRIG